MEEEILFNGYVRVMTKDFGLSNNANDPTLSYEKEAMASNDSRILIMSNTKLVTAGNTSFLKGKVHVGYNTILYEFHFDVDMIPQEGEQLASEVWIPFHQIISIIPEPQS